MGANLTVVGLEQNQCGSQTALRPGLVTRSDGHYIRYIEDKPFDMERVAQNLQTCVDTNHWANFGPVSRRIEADIADRLQLRDNLRVVMCASGTAALHAIINLHESLAGKNLRWITSSFGYYSAIQGPLREAGIVDCDADAMLDLDAIDPNSVDGFIVTNPFGQADDLEHYYRFAATHGKIMCVDAAMAFGSHEHGANECISFHHTKPWGFGEGGCAIVAAEHEALFRSLICFGHEPGTEINRRASNGKISDVACAFGLTRLTQMKTLGTEYRDQYARIAGIGRKLGFDILGGVDEHPGIPASVPFLAPLPLTDFKHPILPTGRYYHPLANTSTAFDLYERIVNVPCHPGIGALSNDELRSALENLINRCF